MEREYGVVGRDYAEGRRLNERLDDVVARIVAAVNRNADEEGKAHRSFKVKSAKILGGRTEKADKVINAFALADGRIYVSLGLLRAIQDSPHMEDELAFVVGHEVTHVVEKHGKGQSKKATEAGLLAILLGAVSRNRAVERIGEVGAAAYVSSFGRKDEYRADRGGVLALHDAGFRDRSAVDMLNRLKAKGESQDKLVNGWFGSHPLTENRVKRVEEMLDDLAAGRRVGDRSEKELDREDRKKKSPGN